MVERFKDDSNFSKRHNLKELTGSSIQPGPDLKAWRPPRRSIRKGKLFFFVIVEWFLRKMCRGTDLSETFLWKTDRDRASFESWKFLHNNNKKKIVKGSQTQNNASRNNQSTKIQYSRKVSLKTLLFSFKFVLKKLLKKNPQKAKQRCLAGAQIWRLSVCLYI